MSGPPAPHPAPRTRTPRPLPTLPGPALPHRPRPRAAPLPAAQTPHPFSAIGDPFVPAPIATIRALGAARSGLELRPPARPGPAALTGSGGAGRWLCGAMRGSAPPASSAPCRPRRSPQSGGTAGGHRAGTAGGAGRGGARHGGREGTNRAGRGARSYRRRYLGAAIHPPHCRGRANLVRPGPLRPPVHVGARGGGSVCSALLRSGPSAAPGRRDVRGGGVERGRGRPRAATGLAGASR